MDKNVKQKVLAELIKMMKSRSVEGLKKPHAEPDGDEGYEEQEDPHIEVKVEIPQGDKKKKTLDSIFG